MFDSYLTFWGIVIPALIAFFQFASAKRAEARKFRFETYHRLIRQLVERDDAGVPMKLDRQIAVLFELRRFHSYFPVTRRILSGLLIDWEDFGPVTKRARLLDEVRQTLRFINSYRWWKVYFEGAE